MQTEMSSTNEQPGVAILAGGASARMGTNKALLRVQPGGPTLIETVVSRLCEANLEPDLLVTNTPDLFTFLNIPAHTDDIPGGGALGGIYTALNHLPRSRILVVACDMPLLNPALLRYMTSLPMQADALVPRWTDDTGRQQVEPLHAIYSRNCIEPVRKRIEVGKLKVQALLEDVQVQYVEEAEIKRHDPRLESFRNINTPEEWSLLIEDV